MSPKGDGHGGFKVQRVNVNFSARAAITCQISNLHDNLALENFDTPKLHPSFNNLSQLLPQTSAKHIKHNGWQHRHREHQRLA